MTIVIPMSTPFDNFFLKVRKKPCMNYFVTQEIRFNVRTTLERKRDLEIVAKFKGLTVSGLINNLAATAIRQVKDDYPEIFEEGLPQSPGRSGASHLVPVNDELLFSRPMSVIGKEEGGIDPDDKRAMRLKIDKAKNTGKDK